MSHPGAPHQHPGYGQEPSTGLYPQSVGAPPSPTSNSKTILVIAACVGLLAALGSAALLIFNFGDNLEAAEQEPLSATQLSELEPVTVTYDEPPGFSRSTNSFLVTPLFPDHTVDFINMDDVYTYESVFVVSYVLDVDTVNYTDEELVDKVSSFGTTIGKLNGDTPEWKSAGGKDAVFDYIEQEGNQGTITYDAYFFFDGPYMIQVGCQPEAETSAVETACQTVLDSLTW
ncbi:MAG TPA: hypothetical protein H9881_01435 [Candidatus Stackebrandtia excrementipullorum]|nr:hypothetical protein [Candidatus Stackebrandtia excrementipullorum]